MGTADVPRREADLRARRRDGGAAAVDRREDRPEEHFALLQDGRFSGVPYYSRDHWVGADLDAPDTDWELLAELIDTSYRQVALQRQLRALDGE